MTRGGGFTLRNLNTISLFILEDAIEENGTTIIDFSVNGESGRYVNYLSIYGRSKESCLKCKTKIEKLKVAGRGTYICSKCQRVYGES